MAFEVEKIYYLNPREILTSSQSDAWLSMFDATTIDYIHNLGESIDYNVMVVKYKMTYNKTDGSYECHSLFDGGDIIMKKNSGMTIIEIILSICIIAIVLVLLFTMLIQVRHQDDNNNIQSNFIINQSTFIKAVEEDTVNYGVKSIGSCTFSRR